MNRKKILAVAASALAMLPLITGCDNISEDDRLIAEPKPIPDPHLVPKKLLIEDFTGVRCPNCPTGAEAIHRLQEENPGKVIAVALHAEGGGPQTQPWGSQDFRTPEAQDMFTYYKPAGLPAAVFNGTLYAGLPTQWYGEADKYLLQEASMTLDLYSDYSATDRKVTVKYDITLTGDISGQLNLMVWLTEDGIIGRQSSTSSTISKYEHNHILRKSFFSDAWGIELGNGFTNGQTLSGEASTELKEDWVAENCNVVVFVQRADNKEVEQSAEIRVIAGESPETE